MFSRPRNRLPPALRTKKDSVLGLAAYSGDLANYSADSASPAARDRLVMAVVRLCRLAQGAPVPAEAASQVSGLTQNLLAFSDPETRLRLAEDLAEAPWPSQQLVWALATGPIDSAAPVLRSSPVLDGADLCALVCATGPDHHIEIARRNGLPVPVTDLLISLKDGAVLTALAENPRLDLTRSHLNDLTAAARTVAALRSPLADHRLLTESQAYGLYAWCDPALRTRLAARFSLKTETLDTALAISDPTLTSDDAAIGAQIAKMHSAGQLTCGHLVRNALDSQLAAFVQGLARLGDLPLPRLRAAVNAESVEPLALACRAVGIDRTVFPQVLAAVRSLNGARPLGRSDDAERIDQAFGGISPVWAARAFRLLDQNQV